VASRAGRSNARLKTKCTKVQPLVIGAFTEPSGARSGVGGLLLGVYEDGALFFCGGVGTGQGWTADVLTVTRSEGQGKRLPRNRPGARTDRIRGGASTRRKHPYPGRAPRNRQWLPFPCEVDYCLERISVLSYIFDHG
jgi:hypothetical protein